jgi:hypothetical protein
MCHTVIWDVQYGKICEIQDTRIMRYANNQIRVKYEIRI